MRQAFSRISLFFALAVLCGFRAGGQQINLQTQAKGTLPLANGGFNVNLTGFAGCPKLQGGVWSVNIFNCASAGAGTQGPPGIQGEPGAQGPQGPQGVPGTGGGGGVPLPSTPNIFAGDDAGGIVATPLFVDLVNGNTVTPGTISSAGLNVTAAQCAVLSDYSGTACATIDSTFHSPAQGTDTFAFRMRVDGRDGQGFNLGNYGGWSNHSGMTTDVVTSTRGIQDGFSENLEVRAAGDAFGHYAYVHSLCSPLALSDEICGVFAGNLDDFGEYLHAQVPSGVSGTGITAINPLYVSGSSFATDETYLINTARGVLHTNLISQPVYGIVSSLLPVPGTNQTPAYLLHAVPVTAGSVPVTTTFCYALQVPGGPFAAPIQPANLGVAQNVTLACTVQPVGGVYTAFPSTGVVAVAGSNYPEQARIVSAGTMDPTSHLQSITVALRNPNESVALFYGGLAGSYLNLDDDYFWTGVGNQGSGGANMRQLLVALGSLDSNSIIFMYERGGNTVSTSSILPAPGVSVAGSASGISIFKGGEITAVTDGEMASTLEPNTMTLMPGDTLEDPHPAAAGFKILSLGGFLSTPCDPAIECAAIDIHVKGAAINGGAVGIKMVNETPNGYYRENGGRAVSPRALQFEGSYNDFLLMDEPANAVLGFKARGLTGNLNLIAFSNSTNHFAWNRDTQRYAFTGPVDFVDSTSTAFTKPCLDHSGSLATTLFVSNCAVTPSGTLVAGDVMTTNSSGNLVDSNFSTSRLNFSAPFVTVGAASYAADTCVPFAITPIPSWWTSTGSVAATLLSPPTTASGFNGTLSLQTSNVASVPGFQVCNRTAAALTTTDTMTVILKLTP